MTGYDLNKTNVFSAVNLLFKWDETLNQTEKSFWSIVTWPQPDAAVCSVWSELRTAELHSGTENLTFEEESWALWTPAQVFLTGEGGKEPSSQSWQQVWSEGALQNYTSTAPVWDRRPESSALWGTGTKSQNVLKEAKVNHSCTGDLKQHYATFYLKITARFSL